ncbi:MAG: histidine phosphatase family protein [Zetaproteobacteria bacterium]|nr:histidine phosphatase family protein [Zetaproteobacteria bacterium]
MLIDLLRHGELQGGVKYRGHHDDDLTEKGRLQMAQVWQEIKGEIDAIYTSPLNRCCTMAMQWSHDAAIPCHIDTRIAEIYYGAWEGLTLAEIEQRDPLLIEQWRNNPQGLTPPDGESMSAFEQRVRSFWLEIQQYHDAGERLLVVAHSGTNRMLLALALGGGVSLTRHLAMPYACHSQLYVNGKAHGLMFHAPSYASRGLQ